MNSTSSFTPQCYISPLNTCKDALLLCATETTKILPPQSLRREASLKGVAASRFSEETVGGTGSTMVYNFSNIGNSTDNRWWSNDTYVGGSSSSNKKEKTDKEKKNDDLSTAQAVALAGVGIAAATGAAHFAIGAFNDLGEVGQVAKKISSHRKALKEVSDLEIKVENRFISLKRSTEHNLNEVEKINASKKRYALWTLANTIAGIVVGGAFVAVACLGLKALVFKVTVAAGVVLASCVLRWLQNERAAQFHKECAEKVVTVGWPELEDIYDNKIQGQGNLKTHWSDFEKAEKEARQVQQNFDYKNQAAWQQQTSQGGPYPFNSGLVNGGTQGFTYGQATGTDGASAPPPPGDFQGYSQF